MKLTYSQKILILSSIVFITVVVLVSVFSNLLLGKITDINDKVKQLDISSQERLKALTLKGLISSSETEREKLNQYFVGAGNAETVIFTKYLENLALESGVTQAEALSYEPAKGMEASNIVSAIRFRFDVSGHFSNVFHFLQAVENLPKLGYLNSVTLDYNADTKVWSASLDFSILKLKN